MTITAKFESTCPNCRSRIAAGERVEWNKGEKARHTVCTPVAATVLQPERSRVAIEDAGVYLLPDGAIAKVQANREKTRTYAKLWVGISGRRLSLAGSVERGEYRYEPGLVELVAEQGRKMTLDEAKQFILLYGQCCRCARRLKDAKSVEQGIGPVCVKYFAVGTTAAQLMGAVDDERKWDAVIQASERAEDERVAEFKFQRDVRAPWTRSSWSRAGDDELEHAAY